MISTIPMPARLLGFAGILPQLIAALAIVFGGDAYRFAALAIAFAYASLILSFLGGVWWGLAARAPNAPAWFWVAAVIPSLAGLGAFLPWVFAGDWPGPSLILLGVALVAALLVDRRLVRDGLAPHWWIGLRTPLSIGLGGLTILIGVVA